MTDRYEDWPELPAVERPGRYLGGELEARPNRRPDASGRLFQVALAFPDVYEIAHGHLGHKILYHSLNGRPGFAAERVYAPWPDWEAVLRRRGRPLASLESRRPLADFDLVGFSLQYELGYPNILAMLDLGGLPIKAADRDEKAPLVAAGGPGAYNPEPLADFFDLFFLGDAEASFMEDMEIIKAWRAEGAPKPELFKRLAGRPGLYIPSLFRPLYGPDGRFAALEPLSPGYEKVARAVAPSLEAAPFPVCQITPLIKPVHDRVVVEISRGCARGCRFCQAGYVYRPVRERRRATILGLAAANLSAGGQSDVSFLSLSAGDHTEIESLTAGFMDAYAEKAVALSLPSLRVKSLSGHLASQIRRVRKTGFTLAPEAGTQRLRDVINKDLTDDDLLTAAERAFSLGWRTLKLYFMTGLPTETDEDLEGMAQLVLKLRKFKRLRLNLGLAHFTPKPHTPFQWLPAATADAIQGRLLKVRALLKDHPLKWNAPGASWAEAALARGDRRLGPVLEKLFRAGARFEAWSESFRQDLWTAALASEGLAEGPLLRPFEIGAPRPYGHLSAGPTEDFLLAEWRKAEKGLTTADCREGGCRHCGACGPAATDLAAALRPGPAGPESAAPRPPDASRPSDAPRPPAARRAAPPARPLLINYRKEGRAAFLGHLELAEAFKRAFRRANLELAFSEGFHPQPKISFFTPLPLGVVSLDEYLKATPLRPLSGEEALARLRPALPEDIVLSGARVLPPGQDKIRPLAAIWEVAAESPVFSPGPPLHPAAVMGYTDKRGRRREYKLAEFVTAAEAAAGGEAAFSVRLTIALGQEGTPRPAAAAAALWGLAPDSFAASARKLKTILG